MRKPWTSRSALLGTSRQTYLEGFEIAYTTVTLNAQPIITLHSGQIKLTSEMRAIIESIETNANVYGHNGRFRSGPEAVVAILRRYRITMSTSLFAQEDPKTWFPALRHVSPVATKMGMAEERRAAEVVRRFFENQDLEIRFVDRAWRPRSSRD